MTITKFIANGNTYTFPTSPGDQSFNTNFANLVPHSTRLPGADGGFDEFGMSRAPADIGSVQLSVVLVAASRAAMQPLRDALKMIAAWGKGRLIDNLNGVERWCWARVNSIDVTENRQNNTDLFQPIKLTFQVSDPYWYTVGTEVLWGGGSLWGGGAKWGGTAAAQSVTTSGSFTITNNGNADTLARITVSNASGSTVTAPRIQRLVNGAIKDELFYNGSILTGTQLILKPQNHTATITGVNVLSNLTFKHPDWMRLLPGSNSFLVTLVGAVTVYVSYYERYV